MPHALIHAALLIISEPPPLPEIAARSETAPPTTREGDRADDPAIWRNPDDPEKSLILSTDKKAGIAIHGLSGRLMSFQPLGDLNNVDLRTDVIIGGRPGTLVAASDRSDRDHPRLRLFRLDADAPRLVEIGSVDPPRGEAYGLCLHRRAGGIDAFMVYEEGMVEQIALDVSGPLPRSRILRRHDLGSRAEGCAADDRTGMLYVAEDKVAIWRIRTDPSRPMAPELFAAVDGVRLHDDVEGLAVLPRGREGGLLFAASQDDDSFAVFHLPGGAFAGGFRIRGGPIDGTEDTDGIALHPGDFGPDWPGGIFAAQDGNNRGAAGEPAPQNFKLVPLGRILSALDEEGSR